MKKILLYFFITIITLFTLSGCNENTTEDLIEKATSEIDFVSMKLIGILNKLNNITFENYQMIVQEEELNGNTAKNEKQSSNDSSQNSDEGSSSSSNSSQANQPSPNSKESTTIISSQLSPNTILTPVTEQLDWVSIKNEIENLYFSWNTIILDLYKLNIESNDILTFSNSIDTATIYIKNEDKNNSELAIAKLYSMLPKFYENISNNIVKKNILQTKAYILNAYALVGNNRWEDAQNEISKADEIYMLINTNAKYVSENSYKVNKVYVLINELKNSMNNKDNQIFYIKYRNLLEEIKEM